MGDWTTPEEKGEDLREFVGFVPETVSGYFRLFIEDKTLARTRVLSEKRSLPVHRRFFRLGVDFGALPPCSTAFKFGSSEFGPELLYDGRPKGKLVQYCLVPSSLKKN